MPDARRTHKTYKWSRSAHISRTRNYVSIFIDYDFFFILIEFINRIVSGSARHDPSIGNLDGISNRLSSFAEQWTHIFTVNAFPCCYHSLLRFSLTFFFIICLSSFCLATSIGSFLYALHFQCLCIDSISMQSEARLVIYQVSIESTKEVEIKGSSSERNTRNRAPCETSVLRMRALVCKNYGACG